MSNQKKKTSTLRRTLAGLTAAGTIALGGLGAISAEDAHAAGVRQVLVVPSSGVQVAVPVADATPKRSL